MGPHEDDRHRHAARRTAHISLQVSVCLPFCWIDCGAGGVCELPIEPLKAVSGVMRRQLVATQQADGMPSDTFVLKVTNGMARGRKASPQWAAYRDACLGSGRCLRAFFALAADHQLAARMKAAAGTLGANVELVQVSHWRERCMAVVRELQRHVVDKHLQAAGTPNLATQQTMPRGWHKLLGLGEEFCAAARRHDEKTANDAADAWAAIVEHVEAVRPAGPRVVCSSCVMRACLIRHQCRLSWRKCSY